MMNSELFTDRLKEAIGGKSVRAFALQCELSETAVRQYLSGRSEPGMSALKKIADVAGVGLEWLVTGNEPREAETGTTIAPGDREAMRGEYTFIPRYAVKASCGSGALVESEQVVDHLAFKTAWLKNTMHLNRDELALISAMGDSMEPTIKEGGILLVDRSRQEVKDDAIYVIKIDGTLVAKRLQRLFDGSIKIKSDNPAYDEQTVPADQVEKLNIIGRVVWGGGRM
ncbi:MAG: transcriptional regulator [Desulfuromonas sp.]|nr:MAG: transcriptional regulator [Desulfuromonas sp.]